jgi:LSD1 subclass zinc finger protein
VSGEVFWFVMGVVTGCLVLMQVQTWEARRAARRRWTQLRNVLEVAVGAGLVRCAQCDSVIFDPVEHGRLFHAARPVGPEDRDGHL